MVVRFVCQFCNHENSPCNVFGSAKCPVFLVWNFGKTPKSTPGAAVLYIRGARVRWGTRRERRETRKFSGLDSPGGTSGASKSDSFPVFVRFLSRNVRRTVAPRPATPPRMSRFGRFGGGGGKVRFFGISGFPRKSGVLAVTGGSDHVHKILVPQTGVPLETLSEVWVQKIFTSRWFYHLFERFAVTKTAPATCLDQQNVQFCWPGTSKKHQNPRQARLCCTSEAHEFGGVGDENGEKRESFRDSTVQVERLWHPSPTESSFLARRVAHVTSHSHTIDPLAEPKPRFFKKKTRVSCGGGCQPLCRRAVHQRRTSSVA